MATYPECGFCQRPGHEIGHAVICMYCARGSSVERDAQSPLAVLVRQGGPNSGLRLSLGALTSGAQVGPALARWRTELAEIADCPHCRMIG